MIGRQAGLGPAGPRSRSGLTPLAAALTSSRRSSVRSAEGLPPAVPIWRQVLGRLGLGPLPGPASIAPLNTRERQRQQELEEAIRHGRWIDDEERALLAEQAAAEREARQRQERLRLQRRGLVLLAIVALVVWPLWPLVILGAIALYPRTSRRFLLAALAAAAAAVLALVLLVAQVLHRLAPAPPSQPAPTSQPAPIPDPARGAPGSSSQAGARQAPGVPERQASP